MITLTVFTDMTFATYASCNGPALSTGGLSTVLRVVNGRCISAISVRSLIRGAVPGMLTRLSPRSMCVPTGGTRRSGRRLHNDFDNVNVRFVVRSSAVCIDSMVRNKPTRGMKLVTKSHVIAVSSSLCINGGVDGSKTVGHLGNPGKDRIHLNVGQRNRGRLLPCIVMHNGVPIGDVSTACLVSSH